MRVALQKAASVFRMGEGMEMSTKEEILSEKGDEVTNKEENPQNMKSKYSKKLLAAGLFTAGVLLLAYFGGVWYFEKHFFRNTTINQVDCGKLTAMAATEKVQNWYEEQYSLEIKDRDGNVLLTVSPSDAGMHFEAKEAVDWALEEQNPWLWPSHLLKRAKEKHRWWQP